MSGIPGINLNSQTLDTEVPVAPGVPQVIFHGYLRDTDVTAQNSYGAGNIDFAKNVTSYVTECNWFHSVNEPHETIDLQLRGPASQLQQILPGVFRLGTRAPEDGYELLQPDTEFWCVLYLPNKTTTGQNTWSAVQWGRCSRIQMSVDADADSGIVMVAAQIAFESWLGVLKKSQIFLAPGSTYIREGYSFDFRSWADEMVNLVQGFAAVDDGIQSVFETLWSSIVVATLPNSLTSYSGKFFEQNLNGSTVYRYGATKDEFLERIKSANKGAVSDEVSESLRKRPDAVKRPLSYTDSIAFVGSRESALVYAPLRMPQMKPVTGDGIGNLGNIIPRGTIWTWFFSTFASAEGIELFPSLEWPVMWTNGPARMAQDATNTTTANSKNVQEAYVQLAEELALNRNEGPRVNYWADGQDANRLFASLEKIFEGASDLVKMEMSAFPSGSYTSVPAPFAGKPGQFNNVKTLEKGQPLSFARVRSVICEALGGSMPVLLYRMKPKMFRPINQEELTNTIRQQNRGGLSEEELYRVVASVPASQRLGTNQWAECVQLYPNCAFPNGNPNWLWYTHDANEMYRLNYVLDDSTRVNGMYTKTPIQPNSQMELHGLIGEILVDNRSVTKSGLRMKTIDWPFFPAGLTNDVSKSRLQTKIEALNEELYAITGQVHTFGDATVEVAYKPWIKAGHWTTGMFPTDHGKPVMDAQTSGASRPDVTAQSASGEGFPGWSGYIAGVRHVCRAMPDGRVSQRTILTLTDFLTIGYGRFVQPTGFRPSAFSLASQPFVFRDGVVIVGHLKRDEQSGTLTFVEGPAPVVGAP